MHKPFLVVAGNIGSGKSSVAERLGEELGLPVLGEPAEANPYLEAFYEDMAGYAYRSQLFFLARGLHQHRQIEARGGGAVLDRSLYEDYLVFASQLHGDGYISQEDFAVLGDLYYGFQDLLPAPHLAVMLEASDEALLERLASRPGAESAINPDYLRALQGRYQALADGWVACPVLRVDTEAIRDEEIVDLVLERLDS